MENVTHWPISPVTSNPMNSYAAIDSIGNLFEWSFNKDFALEWKKLKLKLNPNENSNWILKFHSGSNIFKDNSTYLIFDTNWQIVGSWSINLWANNYAISN